MALAELLRLRFMGSHLKENKDILSKAAVETKKEIVQVLLPNGCRRDHDLVGYTVIEGNNLKEIARRHQGHGDEIIIR